MVSSPFCKGLAVLALACITFAGSGCATSTVAEFDELSSTTRQLRENARKTIARIEVGMSLEEVRGLRSAEAGPYTSETQIVEVDGDPQLLVIQWYYTDLKKYNGTVGEDELTPVVFRDEHVVGWGRKFLSQMHAHFEKPKKQKDVQIK